MDTFRVNAVPRDGVCTLVLQGEADLAVADDIVTLGALSLGEPTTQSLIVDLQAVTFIDSSAIGALIRLHNLATDAGKQFQLAHMPERVRQVLILTSLLDTFEEVS